MCHHSVPVTRAFATAIVTTACCFAGLASAQPGEVAYTIPMVAMQAEIPQLSPQLTNSGSASGSGADGTSGTGSDYHFSRHGCNNNGDGNSGSLSGSDNTVQLSAVPGQ